MSHEVIQVIKLVKYNRRSHEMIRVTCKRIPITINKEIHKNKQSHEMTQFWNRIAVWSSLHEPILIYGSSHGLVFKSPVYRIHNGHYSESSLDLLQRVRISPNESETQQHAAEHTERKGNQHTLIIHSHMYPYKHATRAYTHIRTHIRVYT